MAKFTLTFFKACPFVLLGFVLGCDAPNVEALVQRYGEQFVVSEAVNKENLIDCYNGFCDASYQFCLRSTTALENKWYKTASCRPRPKECDTCECAIEASKEHFSMAKNCKGEIHCTHEDARLVVTCVVPPGASSFGEPHSGN